MTATADVAAAQAFIAAHGRVLERRRFELLIGAGGTNAGVDVLVALDAYRNADGGYGWGLEPDLRSQESQPLGAMHAFGILAEVARESAPTASSRAVELCDWLAGHTLADGGLPFTLPVTDPAGCSAVWLGDDHTTSSLQMTAQVAAAAHLVARHDRSVAEHPWLGRATRWCLDTIGRMDVAPAAHELLFTVRFLDAYAVVDSAGDALLDGLSRFIPADAVLPVEGGTEDEALRPLDIAPRSGAARRLFADDVIAADVARLAQGQQPDGGWTVDFASPSPAAVIEWRGIATFDAIATLVDAGDRSALDLADGSRRDDSRSSNS